MMYGFHATFLYPLFSLSWSLEQAMMDYLPIQGN